LVVCMCHSVCCVSSLISTVLFCLMSWRRTYWSINRESDTYSLPIHNTNRQNNRVDIKQMREKRKRQEKILSVDRDDVVWSTWWSTDKMIQYQIITGDETKKQTLQFSRGSTLNSSISIFAISWCLSSIANPSDVCVCDRHTCRVEKSDGCKNELTYPLSFVTHKQTNTPIKTQTTKATERHTFWSSHRHDTPSSRYKNKRIQLIDQYVRHHDIRQNNTVDIRQENNTVDIRQDTATERVTHTVYQQTKQHSWYQTRHSNRESDTYRLPIHITNRQSNAVDTTQETET